MRVAILGHSHQLPGGELYAFPQASGTTDDRRPPPRNPSPRSDELRGRRRRWDTTQPTVMQTTASISPPDTDAMLPSTPPGPGPDSQALERAGSTAVGAVPGSTLISIETERNGTWEVQVVTADGVEHETDVSGDGADVVAGPVTDNEDEADRAKHRARVQAAQLDYKAAVDAILTAVPNGTITELNIDGENGTTVWEADVVDDSGVKREVTIDAATGQALRK